METAIFLLVVTAIMAVMSLLAFIAGWFLTEVIIHPLNFKPFNCRPCLTFWLTVLTYFVYSLVISPYFTNKGLVSDRFTLMYGITGIGVLAGLIKFLYIKLKFRVYD